MNAIAHEDMSARSRWGVRLQSAAVIVLLAVSVGRCFVAELPHRSALLESRPTAGAEAASPSAARADRAELARSTFAAVLLAACLVGAVGIALDRRTPLPPHWLLAGVGVLGGALAVSTIAASDQRTGQLVYVEQMSLLITAAMATSLFIPASRRRWAVVALVSLAIGLAAKGYIQLVFDIPDRIAGFEERRESMLWMLNAEEGSPRAKLLEARIRDIAPTGFLSLANIYASMLLIPVGTAVGFAVGAVRQAMARDRAGGQKRQAGQIDNHVFFGALLGLIALAAAAMIVLTGSRGAIGAAAVAVVGSAAAWWWRRRIMQRPRRWALGALCGLVGATGGLLAWGAVATIPVKTLAFRWQYWVGAWRVWMHNVWTGTGGGNFQAAYVRHRPVGAEEAVQLPHNVFFGAVGQFGLAGVVFVAVAAWLAVRPARAAVTFPEDTGQRDGPRWGVWGVAAVAVLAAGFARTVFWDWSGLAAVWLWDVGTILILLVAGAVLTAWLARPWREDACVRWGLRAGLAAVLVHNLVSFSLWTPGTAGLFWLSAGMLLAMGRHESDDTAASPLAGGSRLGWLVGGVILVLLVFPAVEQLRAAALRAWKGDQLIRAYMHGRGERATELAWERMKLDRRDPQAAATASRVAVGTIPWEDEALAARRLAMGLEAAREARRRDPADFRRAWRVGQMLWYHAYPDALRFSPEARIEVTRIAQLKQRAKQTGQVQAMHMLGAIHYARGEWDSALQWWIKAAGNRPGSVQARLNQASAAWLADRREDARGTWSMLQPRRWPEGCLEALRAARDRNPTGARQWLDQAELASQCGDIERTDRWIGRALELNEAIDPASVYRFDAADLARAEMLRVRARVLAKNRPEADQAPAVIDP